MRIVGGKWRGRRVEAPEGRGTTRPTTDRAREQIASMVLSARGLDLTGTPALGPSTRSPARAPWASSCSPEGQRGRPSWTATARRRRAFVAPLTALGARGDEVRSLAGDVFALAARGLVRAPFDVVFLDPPYALGAERVSGLVGELAATGQLARGAVVVYEHAADAGGLSCEDLALAKSKRHGITAVDLYVFGIEEDSR